MCALSAHAGVARSFAARLAATFSAHLALLFCAQTRSRSRSCSALSARHAWRVALDREGLAASHAALLAARRAGLAFAQSFPRSLVQGLQIEVTPCFPLACGENIARGFADLHCVQVFMQSPFRLPKPR